MKVGFLPIQTVIGEFIEDFSLEGKEVNEEQLLRWAIDGVNYVKTDEQLCHKVSLLNVRDYRAELPEDFNMLCEIAYRIDIPKNCGTKIQQLTGFIQDLPSGCKYEVNLKCPKCHKESNCKCDRHTVEVKVDRMWEMANSYYNHSTRFLNYKGVQTFGRGMKHSIFSDNFKLLKPATSDWFQMGRHIPKCVNAHCVDCEHSYKFKYPNIELSFRKGEILLAYMATPIDEEGNIMIPNHRDALDAVSKHLAYKWLYKKWALNPDKTNLLRASQIAKQDRDEAVGRANLALQIPSPQDWDEFVRSNRYYKINSGLENLYENGVNKVPRKSIRNSLVKNG